MKAMLSSEKALIRRWMDHVSRVMREMDDGVESDRMDEVVKLAIDLKTYAELLKREALRIDRSL